MNLQKIENGFSWNLLHLKAEFPLWQRVQNSQ
jgi:hypothetical protein